MDLRRDLAFDLGVRYVDALPSLDVESYLTFDARLGWEPFESIELSMVGQNLGGAHHPEFGMPKFIHTFPSEVERSVYVAVRWRF